MKQEISQKALLDVLSSISIGLPFLDKLKVKLRPLICPFEEILSVIPENSIVLDIGCGSGQLAYLVHHFCKPASIIGIEITPRLIDNAKRLFQEKAPLAKVDFQTFNGIDFPAKCADASICLLIDVFHHVPKQFQEQFVKNIYLALPKNALLIWKDINAASPLVIANKCHDLVFAGEIGNEISSEKAIKLLSDSGFIIENNWLTRKYVYPHYTILARK
jgi:SAM-dependent methyltransferase